MTRPRNLTFAVLAVAALAVTACATTPLPETLPVNAGDDEGNSFAVRNVRVFDGERTRQAQTVVVREGRIIAMDPDARVLTGTRVIDGRGNTLLPGFIDAHVHAWGEAQSDALRFGVTSELDMLGGSQRLMALRPQRESLARTAQADLWSAGSAVTAPKGHGTQFGMEVPTLAADGDPVAFVAARLAEGSDYIKLIVEDMSEFGAKSPWPTITPSQVAATIMAVHAERRMALVHATRQDDARHAIAAGADGLVHMFIDAPAAPAFVTMVRERGAFVVPTLAVWASNAGGSESGKLAADARLAPFLSESQQSDLKAQFPTQSQRATSLANALRSVQALHATGVPILAGTDAPNPGTTHGASMHGELELLVRAGLTPEQALAAATSVPARHFSLGDRGRIAVGQRADLVLVEGDPTRDITATRAIVKVWKNGYAIDRQPPKGVAPAPSLD